MEKLAGSDGLVEFREAFYSESKLVIVLFKDGWGETHWTRVERTAIEERFLEEGADFLLFVVLDKNATLPKWLPATRVRLNFADFGLEQLVGAAKHRAQLVGSTPRPHDASAHARRLAQSLGFSKERQRLFDSEEGVNAASAAAKEVFAGIEQLATGWRQL